MGDRHRIVLYLVGYSWPADGWIESIVSSLDTNFPGSYRQFFIMWIEGDNFVCHNCLLPFRGCAVHACRRTAWFWFWQQLQYDGWHKIGVLLPKFAGTRTVCCGLLLTRNGCVLQWKLVVVIRVNLFIATFRINCLSYSLRKVGTMWNDSETGPKLLCLTSSMPGKEWFLNWSPWF